MPLLHSDPLLSTMRSSAAELVACVLSELFPQALMVGGAATDYGFFYDFISDQPMDRQILEILETRAKALIKEGKPIRSLSLMRENAFDFLTHHHQPILAERALAEETNVVSVFQLDAFYGLCPEPHVQSTDIIGCIKLLEIEKAIRYLPGQGLVDVKRIQGTTFSNSMLLKQFVKAYDKLKKFDHRVLGSELNLFHFFERVGQVDCFWFAKGKILLDQILSVWEEDCKKSSVQKVTSPLVAYESFLELNKLRFPAFSIDEKEYTLSSSRSDHHAQIFNYQAFSASEWPIRIGEVARVYEDMESFQLCGLFRSRSYQSDLVSIFCGEEQLKEEINYSLHFINQIITIFEFEAYWYLVGSTSKRIKVRQRDQALEWLKTALEEGSILYELDEDEGDPRIEVRIVDSLGKEWVGSSVTVALSVKERLKAMGCGVLPEVLTRTLFSSLDRFIGLLIEQWKGNFPMWLAPEQVRVLSMGEQSRSYAEFVCTMCRQQGLRTSLDSRNEKLGTKIHAAERERVPYLLIIGDKEVSKNQVSVRTLQDRDKMSLVDLDDFLLKRQEDVAKSMGRTNTIRELGSQLES